MDFTSAKKKFELLQHQNVTPTALRSMPRDEGTISKASDDEISKFFHELSVAGTKPAILSVVPGYSDKYVPKEMCHLAPPLTSLFKPEHQNLSLAELLALAEETTISITESQSQAIELETREQSKSRVWFEQRAGRITASRLKSACHTNITDPSKSLIRQICYPEAHQFSSVATR